MPILLIDNEDSFTHILRQAIHEADDENTELIIRKYSELDLSEALIFDSIVISPGPGHPSEYGGYFDLLDNLGDRKLLGVCLGMQVMGLWKDYDIFRKESVVHGVAATMSIIKPSPYTLGLDVESPVGLYHSWAVEMDTQNYFELLAQDENGIAMMMSRERMLGLQFHPESFMTAQGKKILKNWLQE